MSVDALLVVSAGRLGTGARLVEDPVGLFVEPGELLEEPGALFEDPDQIFTAAAEELFAEPVWWFEALFDDASGCVKPGIGGIRSGRRSLFPLLVPVLNDEAGSLELFWAGLAPENDGDCDAGEDWELWL
jgi:hypothetical protein